MKRVHIHISGKVQGVGFRQFTVRNARRLGVKGWIRNLADGRVEGMLEGEASAVDSLLDLCREGPRGAGVTGLETEKESPQGSFLSFSVKYG